MVDYKNIEDKSNKKKIKVEFSDGDSISVGEGDYSYITFENDKALNENIVVEDNEDKAQVSSQESIEYETKSKSENLSYEASRKVINDIVVDLFKNILTIEEKSLRLRGIKDLSMSEIHALEAIGTGDGKMMSEVADILDITMGTLTTTISKLETKGYAKREKDPNDRRVVIASLTRKGVLVDKIHRNFHEEMIDHLMIDLKLEEDQAFIRALMNINEFFLKEYGGEHGC